MYSVRNKVQTAITNTYPHSLDDSVHRVIPENSSSQEINAFLRSPQVIQEIPPLHLTLTRIIKTQTNMSHFLNLQIISLSKPRKGLFPSGSPTKTLYAET